MKLLICSRGAILESAQNEKWLLCAAAPSETVLGWAE